MNLLNCSLRSSVSYMILEKDEYKITQLKDKSVPVHKKNLQLMMTEIYENKLRQKEVKDSKYFNNTFSNSADH